MSRKTLRGPRTLGGLLAGIIVLGLVALLTSLGVRLPGITPPAGNTPAAAQFTGGAITPVIELAVPPDSREAVWTAALAARLGGQPEAKVEFGRIDVLTDVYAIEIDFLKKWKEGVGQSLHYAQQTGKTACLALIVEGPHTEAEREIAYVDKLCLEKGIKLVLLMRPGSPRPPADR